MFRFLHTSDWQIGKVFRFLDDATMGLLQDARLQAVTRLGEFATQHHADHIFVAGDVYDMEALSPRSINQPIERMRSFNSIQWHLLPGNHDPHRPNGLWDQILRKGLPDNIRVYLESAPTEIADGKVTLLPAPLLYRHTIGDVTAYMDDALSADGNIRIGMAHGTIAGFGSEGQDIHNFITPDRPAKAGLSYLAMGDWHRQQKINDRCWYSGTPEADAFDGDGTGRALLVEIPGTGAVPAVTSLPTGRFSWMSMVERVSDREAVEFLNKKLRALRDDLGVILLNLKIEGAMSLQDLHYFEEEIVDGVSAAFCHLRVDDRQLTPIPTQEDMDRIDRSGFVRTAAEQLQKLAQEGRESERPVAVEALQRLYIEHTKLEGGAR